MFYSFVHYRMPCSFRSQIDKCILEYLTTQWFQHPGYIMLICGQKPLMLECTIRKFVFQISTPLKAWRLQQDWAILYTAAPKIMTSFCSFKQHRQPVTLPIIVFHMAAGPNLQVLLNILNLPTPFLHVLMLIQWPLASLFWWPAELWESDTVGYGQSSITSVVSHRTITLLDSVTISLTLFKQS